MKRIAAGVKSECNMSGKTSHILWLSNMQTLLTRNLRFGDWCFE